MSFFFDFFFFASGAGPSNDSSRMSPVHTKLPNNYQSNRNSFYFVPHNSHQSSSMTKMTSNAATAAAAVDPDTSANLNPSDSESVIDRIKRRSFYCRFNEKKPKRSSTIVGPAAREYYRDIISKPKPLQSSAVSTIPTLERMGSCPRSKSATPINSKDIESVAPVTYISTSRSGHSQLPTYHHHHYHSTPIARSGSSSRARNEHDDTNGAPLYEHPRSTNKLTNSSLLGMRTPMPSVNSSGTTAATNTTPSSLDFLSNCAANRSSSRVSSLYEHSTPSQANTSSSLFSSYNPKRRTSSYITPTASSPSLNGNCYAKGLRDHSIGRMAYMTLTQPRSIRAYDHRSVSLLDSNSMASPCGLTAERRPDIEAHPSCHQYRTAHEYTPISVR